MSHIIEFSLSLYGFRNEKLEDAKVLKEHIHENGVELYIENSFPKKSTYFVGYNESSAFDVALNDFAEFCREFLTKLKDGTDERLLDINPYFIKTVIFWAECGERAYNTFEFHLSMRSTLINDLYGKHFLELLYYNSINKIKCSTVEDFFTRVPDISENIFDYKEILDDLVKYGFINCDSNGSYSINNLGIYILKWKAPYSAILFNNDWPCDI